MVLNNLRRGDFILVLLKDGRSIVSIFNTVKDNSLKTFCDYFIDSDRYYSDDDNTLCNLDKIKSITLCNMDQKLWFIDIMYSHNQVILHNKIYTLKFDDYSILCNDTQRVAIIYGGKTGYYKIIDLEDESYIIQDLSMPYIHSAFQYATEDIVLNVLKILYKLGHRELFTKITSKYRINHDDLMNMVDNDANDINNNEKEEIIQMKAEHLEPVEEIKLNPGEFKKFEFVREGILKQIQHDYIVNIDNNIAYVDNNAVNVGNNIANVNILKKLKKQVRNFPNNWEDYFIATPKQKVLTLGDPVEVRNSEENKWESKFFVCFEVNSLGESKIKTSDGKLWKFYKDKI